MAGPSLKGYHQISTGYTEWCVASWGTPQSQRPSVSAGGCSRSLRAVAKKITVAPFYSDSDSYCPQNDEKSRNSYDGNYESNSLDAALGLCPHEMHRAIQNDEFTIWLVA
jgi:hypothetical protein